LDNGWYDIYDRRGQQLRLKISENHPLIGFPMTEKPVTIAGIWTKIENQYYMIAQQITDASEGNCDLIPPGHPAFIQGFPSIIWNKPITEDVVVQYGETDFSTSLIVSGPAPEVQVDFNGLNPSSLYQARLIKADTAGEIIFSIPTFFSTPSQTLSGIEILFNRSINESYSDGSHPLATGSSVIEADIIKRIDKVEGTLDIAMYNTTRSTIVQAISRAVLRGVAVRYIADDETSNSALQGTLSFPVFFRSGSGIMHHKFVVGDADDEAKAWVWTGSTNFSTNQLATDPNHAYVIHDHALALTYRNEFDEMWGSVANHSDSRTGELKTNNSCHLFEINGIRIESFFSPSDETNCHILEAIQSADHHIQIGLLLLTKDDLIDEMIALHHRGVDVRVIVEDESSSSYALSKLRNANVKVVIHDFSPIFHHKYAIIDEGYMASDPMVITGSHNWTWSADNINDENTLIIHDQSVTNIFRQEFEARWSELNTTSIDDPFVYSFSSYPNPATDQIHLSNQWSSNCTVELINVQGNVITSVDVAPYTENKMELTGNHAPGIYLLKWQWPDQQYVSKVVLIR
jgi:hypothetical protein